MKRRGFTIVELVIVITIMAILLTLAVVNVRSSQANARDDERKADVENIAKHLEIYYSSQTGVWLAGRSHYMGVGYINLSELTRDLPDIDPNSLRAPGNDDTSTISLIPATNTVETTTGVLPQPTIDTYVYQSINTDKTLCYDPFLESSGQDCRRFNLYYRLESDNTVYMLKSKNR